MTTTTTATITQHNQQNTPRERPEYTSNMQKVSSESSLASFILQYHRGMKTCTRYGRKPYRIFSTALERKPRALRARWTSARTCSHREKREAFACGVRGGTAKSDKTNQIPRRTPPVVEMNPCVGEWNWNREEKSMDPTAIKTHTWS